MRRRTIAEVGLVLGLMAALATVSLAQSISDARRPQAKIITFEPAPETSAIVGVIGQVGRPGTYQFATAPTLDLVIAAADGVTPDASEIVRLVRGRRVAQSVVYASAAQEKLQSGDLVIIDARPARSGDARPEKKTYVWLALVGVQERPLIVACPMAHAHPDLIVQKLGQSKAILSSVRVLPPPSAALPKAAGTPLPDSTVLFFDRSQIQANDLPDDLPPILPCGLPEQPDIGAYGVHNAYEERLVTEPFPAQQPESPRFDPLMPIPDPTPIPLPEEPTPTISSAKQSAGSPPVSTVPYSSGPTPIATRRHRLTGLAPSRQSTAADTQSPSWKKRPARAEDELTDIEIDERDAPKNGSGALTVWQMLTIVSGAGLLVGLALAVRTFQQQRRPNTTAVIMQPRSAPVAALAAVHTELKAVVPPPHLPLQSFTATSLPRTTVSSEPMSELTQRQRAFVDLLNHELPIIEEPLALRPGIPLGWSAADKPIRRRDAGIAMVEPPVSRSASLPSVASSTSRQHLDAPHPRLSSGPHLRIGPEAPVERALRQLQGGRS